MFLALEVILCIKRYAFFSPPLQITTRNNDLGEFDCNYHINNYRVWWGCFSKAHFHYLVLFGEYFLAAVENNV